MVKAKRARKAETPKQPSPCLRLRAPYLYPDPGLRMDQQPYLKTRSTPMRETPISRLRRRMIEDMSLRNFGEKTQHDYIGYVKTFSTFLGRSPASATPEDLRRYQVQQSQSGVSPATMNSSVAALRFFFRVTLNHPEMS